jgi:hypothetical protein
MIGGWSTTYRSSPPDPARRRPSFPHAGRRRHGELPFFGEDAQGRLAGFRSALGVLGDRWRSCILAWPLESRDLAAHPDRTPPGWPPRLRGTVVSGGMAGPPLRGHPPCSAGTAACGCTPTTGRPSLPRSRRCAAIASSAAADDSPGGAEPIETFLEAAIFEMVRRPAFTQFLNRRSAVPDERGDLLDQIRAVEALQRENLVAYAAPEPGARRRTKAEYELIAARLDSQLDLLNKKGACLECAGAS